MKLQRKPGTFIAFIDSPTDETILRIETNAEGVTSFTYRLYDRYGILVQDSDGPQELPAGREVRSDEDELLLRVPVNPLDNIEYRLYSRAGELITCSDGIHTQIKLGLRMDGNKGLPGRPPGRPAADADSVPPPGPGTRSGD